VKEVIIGGWQAAIYRAEHQVARGFSQWMKTMAPAPLSQLTLGVIPPHLEWRGQYCLAPLHNVFLRRLKQQAYLAQAAAV